MRVELVPAAVSIVPGKSSQVIVNVTNTATVISGHSCRVLGLDPSWVQIDKEDLSLFPETSGVFTITIALPLGLPAGTRALEIEVRELTLPREISLNRFELTIPAKPELAISLDPISVTGGREATIGVLVENTGNSVIDAALRGKDQENEVEFAFSPSSPRLSPGEQIVVNAKLRAKRPWFGSPKIRPYAIDAGPENPPVNASGAWVQRPRLTRGNLALGGLVMAATVFAIVISAALSQVVSQSNADRDLALQVAEASQTTATGGSSAITGTVTLLSSGAPVSAVTVVLYSSSNLSQPVISTTTNATGNFQFSGLAAGTYKLSFSGAGFIQLWYPDSLGPNNAGVVTLKAGQSAHGIDIHLGGQPATISGQVLGANPTGALLSLELPPAGTAGQPTNLPAGNSGAAPGASANGNSGATSGNSGTSTGNSGASDAVGASPSGGPVSTAAVSSSGLSVPTIVTTETLDASGTFKLAGVPSPAVYLLVVSAPGDAPASQEVSLAGGQDLTGVTLELHKGDGSISGTVSSPSGPLADATISATNGATTVNTVSASAKGEVGSFILSALPTPSTLTLTVNAAGYAAQTLSVTLAPAQQVTGIAITLEPGAGSIGGTVTTPVGLPLGGVNVTVSDGTLTESTRTLSVGKVGSYTVSGLPVPGTYTVTFSRDDLSSQTQAISLPATGVINDDNVDVTMVAETASVSGVVTDSTGKGVGDVAVALVAGSNTYSVVTADQPTAGAFEVDGLPPGTYNLSFTRQGGVPTSVIITLSAGQNLVENETLSPTASIYGYVALTNNGGAVPGAQVNLYLSSEYPAVVAATTTTNASGAFVFNNLAAPQSYIVAVSYPAGSSPQATVSIVTTLGVASPACGKNATGTTSTSTTTTIAGGSSSTTTSTSTTIPSSGASCNPQSDPLLVNPS
jgi:hypothetical protein